MKQLTKQEFLKLTTKGNLVPVFKEVLGDLETPVAAYMKLAKKTKYSFLLESVEGGEKVARFSFIAKDPELVFESKNNQAKIIRFAKGKEKVAKEEINDSPLRILKGIMKPFKFVKVKDLPVFCGGLVGFFSYDVVRFFERLPDQGKDDLKLPDCVMMLAKEMVIFDHLHHTIKLVNCVDIPAKATKAQKEKLYDQAVRKLNALEKTLLDPLPSLSKSRSNGKLSVKSNVTEKKYKDIVQLAKKEIKRGEIIQVVLSQRFSVDLKTDPLNVYRTLRALNPSPYMYYLNFKDLQIVGSSPELLVRCENGVVETRPIAGTRPRGKTPDEDDALAQDLLDDPKEKAEHIMLVDLGRNDLGRVCKKGTVEVNEFMSIERYSHVMHIVSNVKGKLRSDKGAFDVLEAGFPAGTLSGAPKIRAMEIIDKLEGLRRGPYGGCVGYISFSKNLDTCITIRTIVVHKNKAYVQAGAGIVADSKPQKEYQETVNKAKAQIRAIEIAHQK